MGRPQSKTLPNWGEFLIGRKVKKAAKLTTPWASLVPGMRSIHSGQPFQRRGISVNRSTTIMVASILDMR